MKAGEKNLTEIMNRKKNACASYFESEGMFLMRHYEIANYFVNFFYE